MDLISARMPHCTCTYTDFAIVLPGHGLSIRVNRHRVLLKVFLSSTSAEDRSYGRKEWHALPPTPFSTAESTVADSLPVEWRFRPLVPPSRIATGTQTAGRFGPCFMSELVGSSRPVGWRTDRKHQYVEPHCRTSQRRCYPDLGVVACKLKLPGLQPNPPTGIALPETT